MRTVDLLIKKRDGAELTAGEIKHLINGYINGDIPDYQMAAFCMAVYFKGMTAQETVHFAVALADSGDTMDLSAVPGIKVDKHSTGGVADTTTLVVAPLVAAAGVPVAKMAGRGLGHTGGTIDKLESIPGLKTSLDPKTFVRQLNTVGLAVTSQSGRLVPADKKLYALRDVTGTVDSIPLIAGSIMSKKIAAGAEAILLDVKTGSGAFMKTKEEALELAKTMVKIGESAGRETIAIISDMNEPLGNAVGNALEVEEAITVLKGMAEGRLRELSLVLGSQMLVLARKAEGFTEAYQKLEGILDKGLALEKLAEMIAAQGGNPAVVENTDLLPKAKYQKVIKSWQEGWLIINDAQAIGQAAMLLGAGRRTKDDVIDPTVGLRFHARTGDYLKEGQVIAEVHYNREDNLTDALEIIKNAVSFSENYVPPQKLLYGVVTKRGYEEY